MITKVHVHNFQSHADTVVELNKGLTVFVGDSDQGKTALVKRAFLWALFNEPDGDSIVRFKDNGKINKNGERERESTCFVAIEFDNGEKTLIKERTKNKTTYKILYDDGETEEFESVKKIGLDEIHNKIGIRKFIIDEDLKFNINIIGSRDVSLVDLSPAVKGKIIGSFAGTNVIDIANRGVVAELNGLSSSIKEKNKELDNISQKLEEYKFLELKQELLLEIEKELDVLDIIEEKFKSLSTKSEKLQAINQEIQRLNKIISTEETVRKYSTILEEVDKNLISYKNIEKQYNDIYRKEKDLINCIDNIQKSKKVVSAYSIVEKTDNAYSAITESLDFIKNKEDKLDKIINVVNKVQQIEEARKACNKILLLDKQVSRHEELLNNFLKVYEQYNFGMTQMFDNIDKIDNIIKKVEVQSENITLTKNNIEYLSKELTAEKNNYVEMVVALGTCPTCMQPIDEEHLNELINEL